MTAQTAMPWACLTIAEAARQLRVSPGRVKRAAARLELKTGRGAGIASNVLDTIAAELRRARHASSGPRLAVRRTHTSQPSS